jgi:hypothetical protein
MGHDLPPKTDVFLGQVSQASEYDNTRDRIDMDRLGKKQQLERNFHPPSIFSFICVAMSCWVFVIKYESV